MNNKEAAKALLAGKTLKLKDVKTYTYVFDKENVSIRRSDGMCFSMRFFNDFAEWEEVKNPYKKEVIVTCDENGYIKECPRFYPYGNERANKKYKIIIEEIIE